MVPKAMGSAYRNTGRLSSRPRGNDDKMACNEKGLDGYPDSSKKRTGVIEMDKQKHDGIDKPQKN